MSPEHQALLESSLLVTTLRERERERERERLCRARDHTYNSPTFLSALFSTNRMIPVASW